MEAVCMPTDFRNPPPTPLPIVLMRSHMFFLQYIKPRFVLTSKLFHYIYKTNHGSYRFGKKNDFTQMNELEDQTFVPPPPLKMFYDSMITYFPAKISNLDMFLFQYIEQIPKTYGTSLHTSASFICHHRKAHKKIYNTTRLVHKHK